MSIPERFPSLPTALASMSVPPVKASLIEHPSFLARETLSFGYDSKREA